MNGSRLGRGLEELGLFVEPERQLLLLKFVEELLKWNRKVNLTSITDEEEVVEKHLLDSLTLLPLMGQTGRLLDIGSGAGFPGLPLMIARPGLEVVSVDSVRKKVLFQGHVARTLGLTSFYPIHGRIENPTDRHHFRAPFSVITSRALSDLETFIRWAKPYASNDTLIVAMKGRDAGSEYCASRGNIEGQGACLKRTIPIRLPFSGAERHLLVFALR